MMRIFACLLLTLSIIPCAFSEEPSWFEIEIIIFENAGESNLSLETWPDDPGVPSLENAIELIPRQTLNQLMRRLEPLSPATTALTMLNEAPSFSTTRKTRNFIRVASVADERFDNPDNENQAPLTRPVNETPFVLLSHSNLRLNGAAERLKRSSDYNIVLHIAWRQPVIKGEASQLIHIHSNTGNVDDYYNRRLLARTKTTQSATQNQTFSERSPSFPRNRPSDEAEHSLFLGDDSSDQTAFDDNQFEPEIPLEPPMELDGTIAVSLSRYLHINADLVFSREIAVTREDVGFSSNEPESNTNLLGQDMFPSTESENSNIEMGETQESTRFQPYRLTVARRMRSKEIHYLDHPEFGIIAEIIRYKRPTEVIEEPVSEPISGDF